MARSGLPSVARASCPRAETRLYSASSAMLRRRSLNCEISAPATKACSQFKRSEEHTSELQSRGHLVCRLLLEKKKATSDHSPRTSGNLNDYHPDTTRARHSVALVGKATRRFSVRNSWATAWGTKGSADSWRAT